MPTQAALIDTTRRLVAEATANFFDVTVLNNHLLTAYWLMQARVNEIAPEEFLSGATTNIVANQARYARPTYEHIRRYEILQGTQYVELPYLMAEQAIPVKGDWRTSTDGQQRQCPAYYIEGDELVLVPTPTVSVTAGLGVVYFSPRIFGATTAAPALPLALHHLLAYGAAVFALEESKDAAEDVVNGYRARWASVCGPQEGSTPDSRASLKRHYRVSQSRPMIGQNLSPNA